MAAVLCASTIVLLPACSKQPRFTQKDLPGTWYSTMEYDDRQITFPESGKRYECTNFLGDGKYHFDKRTGNVTLMPIDAMHILTPEYREGEWELIYAGNFFELRFSQTPPLKSTEPPPNPAISGDYFDWLEAYGYTISCILAAGPWNCGNNESFSFDWKTVALPETEPAEYKFLSATDAEDGGYQFEIQVNSDSYVCHLLEIYDTDSVSNALKPTGYLLEMVGTNGLHLKAHRDGSVSIASDENY